VVPFFRSKPSKTLVLNVVVILALAISIPFIPLGQIFGFVSLPGTFLLILRGFIVIYIVLVKLMKIWFYRKINPLPQPEQGVPK